MRVVLESLSSQLFKQAKLRRHLESNHEKFVDKTLEVFEEKEHQVKRSRVDRPATWGVVVYSRNKAMRASFSVAWKIARANALHTAGASVIKPAAMEIARTMCVDAVASKLAIVPLSKDTIKRRIQEFSDDVLQQTIASVKRNRKFNLQLD